MIFILAVIAINLFAIACILQCVLLALKYVNETLHDIAISLRDNEVGHNDETRSRIRDSVDEGDSKRFPQFWRLTLKRNEGS